MFRRKIIKITFFIGLFLVLSSSFAFAQPIFEEEEVIPQAPISASAGTLVAATMETAGYKIQEIILRDFSEIFEGLGIIIVVCCFISAVVTISLTGKYEVALWFLMGPPLFFFVLNSRVKSSGADWQFGAFKDKTSSVSKTLGEDLPSASEVSWVFHRYNEVISSTIQGLIGIITDKQLRDQSIFMSRAKIMDDLFSADIQDPGLMELTQYSMAECSVAMNAARQVALGKRDPGYKNTPSYRNALVEFKSEYPKQNKPIASATLKRYLRGLLKTNLEQGLSNVSTDKLDVGVYRNCLQKTKDDLDNGTGIRKGDINQLLSRGVSCEQLWCWMGLGTQTEALAILNSSTKKNLPADVDEKIHLEAWQDIATKLTTPKQLTSLEVEQINPDLSLIPTIIGGHMLRKTMTGDIRSQMLTRFAKHSKVRLPNKNFALDLDPEDAMTMNQRMMLHQQATAQKYEAFTFAMMLPYLQGTLLYVLALTFPFFALMILVPGKAGSFFIWMAGWAWLKMWDLGWAFVMVIDDVLWNLMPHSSVYNPHTDPNHGPVSIFESAFAGDMAYSLTGYYTILGVLLTAVPIITGQIVLGSKAAMGGVLTNGLKSMGQSLGAAASDWVAVEQVYKLDALKEMLNYEYAMSKANTYATPEIKDLHNRIKYDATKGAYYQNIGGKAVYAGAGLTAVGAGAAMTGIGAAAAPWAIGAGQIAVGGGLTFFAGGVQMQQFANEQMVDLRLQNASMHSFEFANTKAFQTIETLRGQTSSRMEHWNVPEVPFDIHASNQTLMGNQDNTMANMETHTNVRVGRQLLTLGK